MLNDQYFMDLRGRNDVGASEKGKSDEDHIINGFRSSYDNFYHDETYFHLQIVPQIHREEEDSKKDMLVVVPDEHSETGDRDDDSDGSDNRCYVRIKHEKTKRRRIDEISSDEESEGFTREVPSVTQKGSKRRREEMSNKMRTLQQLVPNCHKTDKVSVLDKTIEYMKNLKLQLQVMSTMAINPYFPPATLDFGMHNQLLTAMAVGYGQNPSNQRTSSPLIRTLNWPLPPFTNLSFPRSSGQSPFLPTTSLASSPQCLCGSFPYYSSFLHISSHTMGRL